jgi:hypothetical protein
MGEVRIRIGAVPMTGIFGDHHNIAGFEREFFLVGGDETAAMGSDQDLIAGMAVSSIARAVVKGDGGDAQQFRLVLGDEILDLHRTINKDRIGGRLACRRILFDPFEHELTPLDAESRKLLIGWNNTLAAWHTARGSRGSIVDTHLTPEEDAIGDIVDEDGEIDDTLPADLWFRCRSGWDLVAELKPSSCRVMGEISHARSRPTTR